MHILYNNIFKVAIRKNHMMRWTSGKRLIDKAPIPKIFELTKLNLIENTISSRKLKWYGHAKRSDLPVRITLEGHIEGKCHQGRPRQRWRDDIIVWMQMSNWSTVNEHVIDRSNWRQLTSIV